MKNLFLTFLLTIAYCTISIASEYVTGVILLKDNTEKVGLIKTPALKMGWKKVIKFKTSEEAVPENVEGEKIDLVILMLGDTQHAFRYLQHRKFKKNGEKLVDTYAWFYVENMCDKLELYQSVPGFNVNKNNELIFLYRAGDEMAYFFKKHEEIRATYLGMLFSGGVGIGGAKINRVIFSRYFEKDRFMVDKIKSENWDLRNMHDILEHYCTH